MIQILLNLIYLCNEASCSIGNLRWIDSLFQQLSYTIDLEITKFARHFDEKIVSFVGSFAGFKKSTISTDFSLRGRCCTCSSANLGVFYRLLLSTISR